MATQSNTPIPLSEIEGLATIDVDTLSRVVGIGRSAAYAAVKRGDFESMKVGGSYRVLVPALLRKLGVAS